MTKKLLPIICVSLIALFLICGCGIQHVKLDDYVYVGFRAPTKIHVYSPKAAGELLRTIIPVETLRAMALSPDETVLYASHDNGFISAINIYDLQQPNWTNKFDNVQVLGDICVSADGKYIAVLQGELEDMNSQDVLIFQVIPDSNNPQNPPTITRGDRIGPDGQPLEVYDLSTFSAFDIVPYKTVHVGGDLYMMESNPIMNHVYVFDSHKKKVKVIDLDEGKILRTIAYPGSVKRFTVSHDGKTGFAVINGQSSIYMMDLEKMTIGRSFWIAGGPSDCTFSKDDRYLFVGSKFGQCIFVLDLESMRDLGWAAEEMNKYLDQVRQLSFEEAGIHKVDQEDPPPLTAQEVQRLKEIEEEIDAIGAKLSDLDQGIDMARISNMTGPDRLVLSEDGEFLYIYFDDNRIRTMEIGNLEAIMEAKDKNMSPIMSAEVHIDSEPLDFIVARYFNSRRVAKITE